MPVTGTDSKRAENFSAKSPNIAPRQLATVGGFPVSELLAEPVCRATSAVTILAPLLGSVEHSRPRWWGLMISSELERPTACCWQCSNRPPSGARGNVPRPGGAAHWLGKQFGHWNTTVANAWGMFGEAEVSPRALRVGGRWTGISTLSYGTVALPTAWPKAGGAAAGQRCPGQPGSGQFAITHAGHRQARGRCCAAPPRPTAADENRSRAAIDSSGFITPKSNSGAPDTGRVGDVLRVRPGA